MDSGGASRWTEVHVTDQQVQVALSTGRYGDYRQPVPNPFPDIIGKIAVDPKLRSPTRPSTHTCDAQCSLHPRAPQADACVHMMHFNVRYLLP